MAECGIVLEIPPRDHGEVPIPPVTTMHRCMMSEGHGYEPMHRCRCGLQWWEHLVDPFGGKPDPNQPGVGG